MVNELIQKYLEKHSHSYLIPLLADLEAKRLNHKPHEIKKEYKKKVTTMALENLALDKAIVLKTNEHLDEEEPELPEEEELEDDDIF